MKPRQVVATVIFVAALATGGAAQQKPATEVPIVVHYVNVPSTLEDATARAHAVVRARIVGAQFRNRPVPGELVPDVSTAYTLAIVEVLKSDSQLQVPTEVLRPGGDLVTNKGTQRFVEEGFPAFQRGDEYLLFLFWNEYLGTYEAAFGPDAAFRITPDDRLHGLGRGLLARQYTGQQARDIGSRIREVAAARRNK